jgi:hypothetical protein
MLVHEAVELVAGTGTAHAMSAAARYHIGAPSIVVPASQRNKLYLTTVADGFPTIGGDLVGNDRGVELRVYASGTVGDTYESIFNPGELVEVRLSNPVTGDWELVGGDARGQDSAATGLYAFSDFARMAEGTIHGQASTGTAIGDPITWNDGRTVSGGAADAFLETAEIVDGVLRHRGTLQSLAAATSPLPSATARTVTAGVVADTTDGPGDDGPSYVRLGFLDGAASDGYLGYLIAPTSTANHQVRIIRDDSGVPSAASDPVDLGWRLGPGDRWSFTHDGNTFAVLVNNSEVLRWTDSTHPASSFTTTVIVLSSENVDESPVGANLPGIAWHALSTGSPIAPLPTASTTSYDNTTSDLTASNAQAAIDELAAKTLNLIQIVSGDVTIATFETAITGSFLADSLFLLGYPSLVSVSPNIVAGPYPGGTVTGGSGPGIYRFDGTNLTFESTPELGTFYVPGPTVFDGSGTEVGSMGNLGAVLSIDFDGPGGDDPIETFGSVGVASTAVAYDNTTSGLTASTVKAALDELAAAAGVVLSDADPDGLGTAAPGVSDEASRSDHVHEAPTGTDVSIDSTGYTGPAAGVTNAQELADAVDLIVASSGGGLQAVRAATTGNITLSGAQTIDGVSVIAGDDVLVKEQSTPAENSVYTAAAGAWSLATWDAADVTMIVREGTVNGGRIFTNASNVSPLEAGITASQVVSGELDPARIPNLPASKIASGELEQDRIRWGGGMVGFAPAPSTLYPATGGVFPLAETIPSSIGSTVITNTSSSLVSGRLQLTGITLLKGMPITHIAHIAGSTSLATGTHQWFGVWADNYECLAVTVNDTNTSWGNLTIKALALAGGATYVVPYTGKFYVGINVTATTVPTLRGSATHATYNRTRSLIADTGQTTPPAVGSFATPSAMHTVHPYAWVGGAA